MRPAGEIRQALLSAAVELATPERAATLAELAERAQVGRQAAMHTVKNMRRSGELVSPRSRRVAHRNRPVAEYAPAPARAEADEVLSNVMLMWVNR